MVDNFYHDSYVANKASNKYSFTGNHEIVLMSMIPVDPTESWPSAPRSGGDRFGTVTDVEDVIQTLALSHHTKWTKSIDGSDNSQQAYMKRAGDYMALMMREKINPLRDKYTLQKWCNGAGIVATSANAPTKSTIVGLLLDIEVAFSNAGVPADDRFVFMGFSSWKLVRMADEFINNGNALSDKTILRGEYGRINTLRMVFVPDSYMPTNVYALAVHKESVLAPLTWKTARVLETTQGFDGPVMEYHDMWDAFVIGARNKGVYVLCASAKKAATPTVGSTSGSGASISVSLTSSGAKVYYTLDGTDPKWSDTAEYVSSGSSVTIGTFTGVLRCAAKLETAGSELYWSDEVKKSYTSGVLDA